MGLQAHLSPFPVALQPGAKVKKKVFFYRPNPQSKSQVERYLADLQKTRKREWAKMTSIIAEYARTGCLAPQFRSRLRGKIWEFRAPRPFQPRVAFAEFPGDVVLLLLGVTKKQDPWKGSDLDAAEARLDDISRKMEDDK